MIFLSETSYVNMIENYLGNWVQQATQDNEAYNLACSKINSLQITCDVKGLLSNPFTNTFKLENDAIINNDVEGIQGKLDKHGTITWYKNGSLYTIWDRRGK